MGVVPNTVAANELKRRGVSVLEERLGEGPVHIIRRNRPVCVVLREQEYAALVEAADEARLAASLQDLQEGRVAWRTAAELMSEIAE